MRAGNSLVGVAMQVCRSSLLHSAGVPAFLGAAIRLAPRACAWPVTLPEQVSAVQQVLMGAGAPLAPQDVARAFKGKRAATLRPVLDALAGIGMARRLKDRRYAA